MYVCIYIYIFYFYFCLKSAQAKTSTSLFSKNGDIPQRVLHFSPIGCEFASDYVYKRLGL